MLSITISRPWILPCRKLNFLSGRAGRGEGHVHGGERLRVAVHIADAHQPGKIVFVNLKFFNSLLTVFTFYTKKGFSLKYFWMANLNVILFDILSSRIGRFTPKNGEISTLYRLVWRIQYPVEPREAHSGTSCSDKILLPQLLLIDTVILSRKFYSEIFFHF